MLLATTLVAVAVWASVRAAPAGAQEPPTTITWSEHTLVVTATSPGSPVITETPGSPSSGPRYFCAWFRFVIEVGEIVLERLARPVAGQTYLFHCWSTDPWFDPHPAYPVVAVFDPVVDPPGPLVTTPEVARFAVDHIEFERPGITTAPATTHVVGIESWFALASALDYAPVSAQAGPVWATVRPEFRDVTWHFGDGRTLVCTDATTRWDPAGPAGQIGECTHSYETSSDAAVTLSATATWVVWQRTDRTNGNWVEWGTVSLSAGAPIRVIDLRAVIH